MNQTQEHMSEKNRQYRSNQGRSPSQMSSSYKGLAISGIGILLCLLYLIITS